MPKFNILGKGVLKSAILTELLAIAPQMKACKGEVSCTGADRSETLKRHINLNNGEH